MIFPSSVLPVKQFESWLKTLYPPVKLEEASYWDEDTLKSGMADAGVNKYQTGTVKKYLADLKKTLDAPAPQPGKPPLLPLYFSGRDVGFFIFLFFSTSPNE